MRTEAEILSLIGIDIPKFIEWPRDMFALCEFVDLYGGEAGIVHVESFRTGRISFSGLLSKGKPPEKRNKCILFEQSKFLPIYVALYNKDQILKGETLFEVKSCQGDFMAIGKELPEILDPLGKICESLPAISIPRDL